MQKFLTYFFLILILPFEAHQAFGQNINDGCISIKELKKLHQSNLGEINSNLILQEWTLKVNNSKSKILKELFGYSLKYDENAWSHPSTSKLFLFSASRRSAILVYKPTKTCYEKMKAVSGISPSSFRQENSYEIGMKNEEGKIIEYRSYRQGSCYVLVYMGAEVQKEVAQSKELETKQKANIAEQLAAKNNGKVENKDSVIQIKASQDSSLVAEELKRKQIIFSADSLFEKQQFQEAKALYESLHSRFPAPHFSAQINECNRKICLESQSNINALRQEKDYSSALIQLDEMRKCLLQNDSLAKVSEIDSQIIACKSSVCEHEFAQANKLQKSENAEKTLELLLQLKKCRIEFALDTALIHQRIQITQKDIYKNKLKEGDQLAQKKEFQAARSIYLEAQKFEKNDSLIQSKLKWIDQKEKEELIAKVQAEAMASAKKQDYPLAIIKYNELLTLDSNRKDVAVQVAQMSEKMLTGTFRKDMIYPYKTIQPNSFYIFRAHLGDFSRSKINATPKGKFSINLMVNFDTLGRNLSQLQRTKNLKKREMVALKGYLKNDLSSPQVKGINVLGQEKYSLNVRWSTSHIHAKTSDKRGDAITPHEEINAFLSLQNSIKYGKYTFEKKNVSTASMNLNFPDTSVNYIFLTKCSSPGPSNALFSLISPGLGTLKVTNGDKGLTRLVVFLSSSSLAFLSYQLSNNFEQKYKNATNRVDYDRNYQYANQLQRVSLVTGGLSVGIYLYDLAWVIHRGKMNKRSVREINATLSNQKIPINQIKLFE